MPPSLLDSDTLSQIIKRRNSKVMQRTREYLAAYGWLTFSLMTRFEVLRGFKVLQARRKLIDFEDLCRQCEILPITDSVIVRAADVYADLRAKGAPIGDADMIIAATALVHNLTLVTNNTAHFNRIPGLTLDNWMQ